MDTDTHAAVLPAEHGMPHPYHLVAPSPWPILGGLSGLMMVGGIVTAATYGNFILLVCAVLLVWTLMVLWWRDVIHESHDPSMHTPIVRIGLRYGMALFITSEVCFFVAFFWAFFNYALYPSNISGAVAAVWPPVGIHTFNPFSLPLLNTMLLLCSGCTVTWAHHALIEGDRKHAVMGLGLTILLGLSFTLFQAVEYHEAPFHFEGGGVYPSTFFLATGFHGFHVMVGTTFLIVCFFRARRNEFTPTRHFGFEAAAWYWHFVDVVWLFLFFCIYWWGAGPVAHE